MRFGMAMGVVALMAGQIFADITGRPVPKPPVKDGKWAVVDARLNLMPLTKDKQSVILEIPREVFNQIKKAALDEKDAESRGLAFGSRNTVVAGIALSLAFVSGGLWLARRGTATPTALGIGAVAVVLSAASLVAIANSPAPRPPVGNPMSRISIQINDNIDTIRLHLPEAMLPK